MKRTWTGSAFSTNEIAWSVMVMGSQSCVWSGPQGRFTLWTMKLDQDYVRQLIGCWSCLGTTSIYSKKKWQRDHGGRGRGCPYCITSNDANIQYHWQVLQTRCLQQIVLWEYFCSNNMQCFWNNLFLPCFLLNVYSPLMWRCIIFME